MNATLAFCAIAVAGWVSPGTEEPIAPLPENLDLQPSSQQLSHSQPTSTRPARERNEGAASQRRMPAAPTDPRVFFRDDLPVPPTMNYNNTFPVRGTTGALATRRAPAGSADNNNRRLASQKPFDNYQSTPAVSPYLRLNSPTANGTISPYMVYVRPAQEQQQAGLQFGGMTSSAGGTVNQPAPGYAAAVPSYGQ